MHERIFGDDPEVIQRVADLHPAGWPSTPEQIADAILWLCTEPTAFMTGPPLVIDDGWLVG